MTSGSIFISYLNTTGYGYLCHSYYRNYQCGKYLYCVQTICPLWSCDIRHGYRDDLHKMPYLNLWIDIKGLPNK